MNRMFISSSLLCDHFFLLSCRIVSAQCIVEQRFEQMNI